MSSTTTPRPTPTSSAPAPTTSTASTTTPKTKTYSLRVPKSQQPPPQTSPYPTTFTPPSRTWISGKWYVTHSSLPLWKEPKRNVSIAYELLDGDKVKDTTSYQDSDKRGAKIKEISGINTPPADNPGAYDWRGTGWLKIATSHWEILGWGDVVGEGKDGVEGGAAEGVGNRWIVTYFSKTLFTPAGIDIYSRDRGGLPAVAVEEIKRELAALESTEINKLVDGVFEVKHDDEKQ